MNKIVIVVAAALILYICSQPTSNTKDSTVNTPVVPIAPQHSADWRAGFADGKYGRTAKWPKYVETSVPHPDPLRSPDRTPRPPGPLGHWVHNAEYELGYKAGEVSGVEA